MWYIMNEVLVLFLVLLLTILHVMIFEGENCWAYDKKLNELKIEK